MRLISLVLLSLSLLIFLSGCANSFPGAISGSRTNIDSVPTSNLGGQGVIINWIEGMPHESVNEKEKFQIGIELLNKGYHNITKDGGLLTVLPCPQVRIGDQSAGITTDPVTFNITRTDSINLVGGRQSIFFDAVSLKTEDDCFLQARICYNYITQYSAQICVDTNPRSTTSDKSCTIQTPITASAQGAPVAVDKVDYFVTKIDEGLNSPQETYFEFDIFAKNVGSGRIIEDSFWGSVCKEDANLFKEKMGIIKIDAEIGGQQLTCNPETIKIDDIKTEEEKYRQFFKCKTAFSQSKGTYSSTLHVELYYGYIQASQKTLVIEGEKESSFGDNTKYTCTNCKYNCGTSGIDSDASKLCPKNQLCCASA